MHFAALLDNDDGQLDNSIYVNESSLYPYYKDTVNDTQWKRVPQGVKWTINFDYSINKVTLTVPHFSVYTLFGIKQVPPSDNLNNVIIFPNPFRPNDGRIETGQDFYGSFDVNNMTGIHIKGLTQNCSIKIYNILGQEVRKLMHQVKSPGAYHVHWNGTDNAGYDLPSGMYIYQIRAREVTTHGDATEFVRHNRMVLLR